MTTVLINQVDAIVNRVIDGDTFVAQIDLHFLDTTLTLYKHIRMHGIDAPEMKNESKQKARESKVFLEQKILNRTVTLMVIENKLDDFGRVVAHVYFEGKDLCQEMIDKGFAVPYTRKR